MKRSPYVIGQWVRQDRFYGRRPLLSRLLDGPSTGVVWLVGLRRIGKTSVLRQLEHLDFTRDDGRVPLYWDLEDAEDEESLGEGLTDALFDAETELARLGLDVELVEDADSEACLGKLADQLDSAGQRLLLLFDEAERLATLPEQTRGRLAAALRRFEAPRVIAASGPRLRSGNSLEKVLAELVPGVDTAMLGAFTDEEAAALVRQDQLPPEHAPSLAPETVHEIVALGGGHPYLTQMLAKRCAEGVDAESAWLELRGNRSLGFFHRADFDLLDQDQQQTLLRLASEPELRGGLGNPECLAFLHALGTIRRLEDGRYRIANASLEAWLRAR